MEKKYLWVLLEAGETKEVFATFNEKNIDRLADMFLNEMEDEEDPDSPKSVEEIRTKIFDDVVGGVDHRVGFGIYELYRQEINVAVSGENLLEDKDFDVKSGAVIFEAAQRIVMGCDMAYALSPIGYFSRRIDEPMFEGAEWVERRLL